MVGDLLEAPPTHFDAPSPAEEEVATLVQGDVARTGGLEGPTERDCGDAAVEGGRCVGDVLLPVHWWHHTYHRVRVPALKSTYTIMLVYNIIMCLRHMGYGICRCLGTHRVEAILAALYSFPLPMLACDLTSIPRREVISSTMQTSQTTETLCRLLITPFVYSRQHLPPVSAKPSCPAHLSCTKYPVLSAAPTTTCEPNCRMHNNATSHTLPGAKIVQRSPSVYLWRSQFRPIQWTYCQRSSLQR